MSRSSAARGVCCLLSLFLFLVLLAPAAFAHDRDADARLARHLDADVLAAKITANDAVALKVAALLGPDLLPSEYRGELPHCGTGLVLELMKELPDADPNVQELVRYTMSSPSKRRNMIAPSAEAMPLSYRETARELLRRAEISATALSLTVTPHFVIHYDNATVSAATVSTVGAALEQSYAVMTGFGFAPPVPSTTSLIDVILTNNVPCPAFPIDICDITGAAVPPGFDISGFTGPAIFLQESYSTTGKLQTTAAHEFFHLLQYQGSSAFAMLNNYWWCEGSATAAEDVVFPAVNDYLGLLGGGDGFFARTNYSIGMLTYESVLYHKFLMEKYSGGTPVILQQILANLGTLPSVPNALNAVLPSYGSNPTEAFKHFALWNFHSNTRAFPPHSYGDASLFPPFTNFQGTHTLSASVPSVPSTPTSINGSAAHYFQFRPHSSMTSPRKLTIKASAVSINHARGWVVIRRFSGAHEVRELTGLAGSGITQAETTINDFGFNTVGEVVLILSNGFTGTDPMLAHYEAKLNPALDIAFAMDTTGSMGGSITAIKNTAIQAMQTLGANGADFRIAITEFKDHPISPYGSPGDFPYRGNSPFSNQPSVILGGLSMLVASGGADWPESQYSGVMGAINAVNITPWRNDAKKSIIVMTDAPPHDPEPVTGYTAASVIAAANAGGVSLPPSFPLTAIDTPATGTTATALPTIMRRPSAIQPNAGNPIRIYGIVVGFDSDAYYYLNQLAAGTGGKVYSATYNVNDIIAALMEVVGDIGEEPEDPPVPTNNPPNVSSAIGTPSPLWPANNQMVPIVISNVTDPDGDTFTINVTGVTQDEPVNAKNQGRREPDATGVGTATASVRAERDGGGNGRVYVISFTATDSRGASASGSVTVCVPHDQGGNSTCTDDGQAYHSTTP